jgi:hypothetical protein
MLLMSIALVWLVLAAVALIICVGMLRSGHQEDVERKFVED